MGFRRHLTTQLRLTGSLAAALLASLFVLTTACSSTGTPPPTTELTASPAPLKLALYPYVPRPDQIQAAVESAWTHQHPDVPLEFVDWDCYSDDPPKDLDVFVFDAVFLDYFQSQGYLSPIAEREIENPADFFDYAFEGSRIGGEHYGIPQYGCTNVLFYRRGDRELEQASTLSEIAKVLRECTYTGLKPPPGVGLMVDLSGGTGDACLYLDAVEDIFGKYTPDPPLPPDADKIDSWAIDNLRTLLRMASEEQASYSGKNAFQRGVWFGEGLGRAMIGFTESMSAMGTEGRSQVQLKLMPFADREDVSLFYADLAAVNASIQDPHRRQLAVALANLVASTPVLVEGMGPAPGYDYPQYLLPVRKSVLNDLAGRFPLYRAMGELVEGSQPELFRIGAGSRGWIDGMKGEVRGEVFAAPACREGASQSDGGP